jgi:Uma2 family endonuclease
MGYALRQEEPHWSYKDYKDWELKPGERYELIDGTAYAMSAPGDFHQAILGDLYTQFSNFLRGKPCVVRAAPYDVRLFAEEDESDDTVVQPDITIVCDKTKRYKGGVKGAPEMVVEIVSPSNSAEDMHLKFRLYKEAGVKEYWVVYPEDKAVVVYLFNDENTYSEYTEKDKVPVKTLPGLEIDLSTVFINDLEDEST